MKGLEKYLEKLKKPFNRNSYYFPIPFLLILLLDYKSIDTFINKNYIKYTFVSKLPTFIHKKSMKQYKIITTFVTFLKNTKKDNN